MLEGLEVRLRMFETSPGDTDVLVDHLLPFSLELEGKGFFQDFEVQAEQEHGDSEGHRVLDELVAAFVAELVDGHRAKLGPFRHLSRLDSVAIKDDSRPRAHQSQMPVHRVLVQSQQQIELVAVGIDLLVAGAHGEKDVAAADDGLVGVVGVQVQSAAHEGARENVARGGDSLSGRASDG